MSDDAARLDGRIDDGASVLVLAGSRSDPDDRACVDLLTRHPPATANVLSVALDSTPDDRLALWRRAVGESLPPRAAVVDARPADRDPEREGSSEVAAADTVGLDVLPPDADTTAIGLAVAKRLGEWSATGDPTQLCLHSVGPLLDSFPTPAVVSLLDGLNRLGSGMAVSAHHHLDPAGRDDATLASLRPLYDAVATYEGDGWTVEEPAADAGTDARSPRPPAAVSDVATAAEPAPRVADLDGTLALVADATRRALLSALVERVRDDSSATLDLTAAAEAVVDRTTAGDADPDADPDAVAAVRLRLAHVHLPKLVEAGVVEFDREDGVVRYRGDADVEAVLASLARLRTD